MRLSTAEAINADNKNRAENLAGLMQITPEFIQEHGRVTVTYPMPVSPDGVTASFSMENGVPVDENGEALEPVPGSELARVNAYDGKLVRAGLGHLASPAARMVWHIGSIEAGPTAKSNLTCGFIESIGALHRIGNVEPGDLTKKTAKELGVRTVGLVQTLGLIVVKHPDRIHLPEETPTKSQAVALNGLMHMFKGRRFKDFRDKANEIIEKIDRLPVIDTESWQEELRFFRLDWMTKEEVADYRAFIEEAAARARENYLKLQSDEQ